MTSQAPNEEDRTEFIRGYEAAWDDLEGPGSITRMAAISSDVRRAAERSFDDPGWLEEAVAERQREHDRQRGHEPTVPATRAAATIYVFRADDGRVKIGLTRGPISVRKAAVEAAAGLPLEAVASWEGTEADERALHERFVGSRIRGEWFEDSPEVLAWLEEIGGGE